MPPMGARMMARSREAFAASKAALLAAARARI